MKSHGTLLLASSILTAGMTVGAMHAVHAADLPAFGARVLLIEEEPEECTNEAVGAIAAALLPSLVDQGLGFLQEFLKESAEKHSAQYTATAASIFFSHCQGELRPRIKGLAFGYGPVSGGLVNSNLDPKYQRLGFVGEPSSYLEAEFSYHQESSEKAPSLVYFKLIPKIYEFNKPVAIHGKQKDVLLSASFEFPAAYNGEGKPAGGTLSTVFPLYENVTARTVFKANEGLSSGWILVPGTPPGRRLGGDEKVSPVNVVITAKESEKGRGAAILIRVNQAITDSKKDLAAAILDKVGVESAAE